MKTLLNTFSFLLLIIACDKDEIQKIKEDPYIKLLEERAASMPANPIVKDCDGNIYHVVKIGNQVWMAENLRTTKYRDCGPIRQTRSLEDWKKLTSGTYTMSNIYGGYYNWYAATNTRGIAPPGWHVPTRAEWVTLINFLGGTSTAGNNLKSINGFNVTFPGYLGQYYLFDIRLTWARFSDVGTHIRWWGSTNPWSMGLNNYNGYAIGSNSDAKAGLSIRCILDANLQINIDLTTKTTSVFTPTTAVSGGIITNSGLGPITERGVCFSTLPNPTTANNIVRSGTGLGNYNSIMTGLAPHTIYYVRSYAINSSGTAYGNEQTFTTIGVGPTPKYKLVYVSGNAQSYPGGGMPFPMVFKILHTASNNYISNLNSVNLTLSSSADVGYDDGGGYNNINDYCNDQTDLCYGGYWYHEPNYSSPYILIIKVSLKENGIEIDYNNLTQNIISVYGLDIKDSR